MFHDQKLLNFRVQEGTLGYKEELGSFWHMKHMKKERKQGMIERELKNELFNRYEMEYFMLFH